MSDPAPHMLWQARSAWQDILRPAPAHGEDHGVTAEPRDGLSIASVIAWRGRHEAASRIAESAYGVTLPTTPRAVRGGTCDFAWSGPGSWLAVGSGKDLASELEQRFAGCASVADQSHARAVLRVGGRNIRETLAKGCPVDLHPRDFGPGTVAITSISHIGATIWQVDDRPTYDLFVFRSLAQSFWAWFSASAGQYGLDVKPPAP